MKPNRFDYQENQRGKKIFRRRLIVLVPVVVSSLFAALFARAWFAASGRQLSFGSALLWQTPLYLSWACLAPAITWIGERFRLRRETWAAKLPAYTVFSFPVALLHAAFTVWVTWLVQPILGGTQTDFSVDFRLLLFERLPVDILFYWAIVAVVYAVEYYTRYTERARTAIELEAHLTLAQLQALRMQLQPHFIFNTLQAITVLIKKDPAAAQRMTRQLGDILRTTLRVRDASHEVTLGEELALIKDYLEIEQVRFSDSLTVDWDVSSASLECSVPDFILQPLIENALKHGLAPRPGTGGRLSIQAFVTAQRLILEVTDNGVGLPSDWRDDGTGDGIGLANTRARLQTFYGANHNFNVNQNKRDNLNGGDGVSVRLELPARRTAVAATAAAAVEGASTTTVTASANEVKSFVSQR